MNKEQKKPQEEWETDFDVLMDGCLVIHINDTKQYEELKDFIRTNFIAKRDLRKLLGGTRDRDPFNPFWTGAIDDLKAEIEKI